MSDKPTTVPEELGRDEVIRITDEDLKGSNGLVLYLEGERVEVPTDVAVGYRDIVREEVKTNVDIKDPVSERVSTQFNFGVLSNLREDIKQEHGRGKNDKDIKRDLMVRYHPDLYAGESAEVIDRAKEYTQALGALQENGEINP